MAGEEFRKKLYDNLLRLLLLVGLLPISNHMSAMQAMSIDAAMTSSMGLLKIIVQRKALTKISPLHAVMQFARLL